MQYWWHHKTQHAPFGLSVLLLVGFCVLAGLGVWYLLAQRGIGVPEIIVPEVLNTVSSPAVVQANYQSAMNDLLARLDKPDAAMAVDVEKQLLSVRVPKEKLDAHLAVVLAWNRLDKTKLTPAELATQVRPLVTALIQ